MPATSTNVAGCRAPLVGDCTQVSASERGRRNKKALTMPSKLERHHLDYLLVPFCVRVCDKNKFKGAAGLFM